MHRACLVALALSACGCYSSSQSLDSAVPIDGDDNEASVVSSDQATEAVLLETCAQLGLPAVAFRALTPGATFGAAAGDFAVPVLATHGFDPAGVWTLSQQFSGCDNYLFIVHQPDNAQSQRVWQSDAALLLLRSTRNVHVFFVSSLAGDTATDDVAALAERFASALATIAPKASERWRGRIHFVSRAAGELDGWLGQFLSSVRQAANTGFAIDRQQHLRTLGAWDNFGSADAELTYFNWEANASAASTAEPATDIPVWTRAAAADANWTGESLFSDISFPDAATMATFDTMKLDMALDCNGVDDSACPPWDSLVNAYLCDAVDPTSCDTEIGRWVSAFGRPGHWVTDATPLLSMLQEGGIRRLRFHTVQPYLVTMSFRLENQGSGGAPSQFIPLWTGGESSTVGGFDETYNSKHPDKSIVVPADAKKVQLVAFITGHGWGKDQDNCAEFCNSEHEFKVNGVSFVRSNPKAGTGTGCSTRVSEGVVPNQYGTWKYGRDGWCPGLDVPLFVANVTSAIQMGEVNVLSYRGLFKGADYVPVPVSNPPDNAYPAEIQLSSWLVIWQ